MQAKRKTMIIIMVMVIILLTRQLLGEIRATGKLLISTANGEKLYDAVIIIKRVDIMIECKKKIFRPFNEFDAPKQAKIKVSTAEIYKIEIKKEEKEIYLIAKDSFYQRYRHLFQPVWRYVQFMPPKREKKQALIFVMDNPAHIQLIEENLVNW